MTKAVSCGNVPDEETKKVVFNQTITNLLEIGQIEQYLLKNYLTKQISVRVFLSHLSQPLQYMNTHNDVSNLSAFLKDNLNTDNLHIVVFSE